MYWGPPFMIWWKGNPRRGYRQAVQASLSPHVKVILAFPLCNFFNHTVPVVSIIVPIHTLKFQIQNLNLGLNFNLKFYNTNSYVINPVQTRIHNYVESTIMFTTRVI